MNKIKCLAVLLLAVGIFSCNSSSKVAATIDGKPIYMEEVDQAFGGKVAEQVYELRRNALDGLVEQKLLEQAAAGKKLTVENLIKQEVESKVSEPTDEEIKAIYDANKDRFGGSFEEAKPTISGALKRNRAGIEQQQFLAGLQKDHKVEIKLTKPPVRRVEISADDDPCLGPKDAKVTVIEFSDFQCPFCGRARPTVKQMLDSYPNDLKYCFRDFPLSFHQDAFLAHVASQCVFDQNAEKFWDFNQKLFDNQRAIKPEQLKKYAQEVGVDGTAFNQCLDTQKFAAEVQKDLDEGAKAGVTGTPGFFVNGILVSGAQPFSKFKEIIDEELKK